MPFEDAIFLSGIKWYVDCMSFASREIDELRPPADGFKIKMYHCLYVVNLFSLHDLMCENYPQIYIAIVMKNIDAMQFSGAEILDYARELRNGIIHRGLDPTTEGVVVNGIVRVRSPRNVTNKNGNKTYSPALPLIVDIFRICESAIKSATWECIETRCEIVLKENPQIEMDRLHRCISNADRIPESVRNKFMEMVNLDMIVENKVQRIGEIKNSLVGEEKS